MSDSNQPQAKGTTTLEMRVETLVRSLLNDVLPKSVNGVPSEYGGVICLDKNTGKLGQTGPFQSPGNSVNVGQDKPNMGCPDGTKPVAWYHTHPFVSVGGLTFASKEFIGNDKFISDDKQIPGYLGVYDGTFWRYDPSTGQFLQLNGRLKNTLP